MVWDDLLMLLFTGVVAGSTMIYAILTWRLVSETKKMREAQTEPRISIRIELDRSGDHEYELVISNEGPGVAMNVKFSFLGDPSYFRDTFVFGGPPTVDQLPVIKDGLDSLESGQVFRFLIGRVTEKEI